MSGGLRGAGKRYIRQRQQDKAITRQRRPAKDQKIVLRKVAGAASELLNAIAELDEERLGDLIIRTGRPVEFENDLAIIRDIGDQASGLASFKGHGGPKPTTAALTIFVAELCAYWERKNKRRATSNPQKLVTKRKLAGRPVKETIAISEADFFIAKKVRKFDRFIGPNHFTSDAEIAGAIRRVLRVRKTN